MTAPAPGRDRGRRIDLHAHTTRSDGVLTPSALVEHALARGVGTLAVTDHDTLRGLPEATARGADLGVEVIAGIEATAFRDGQEIHILGFFVDPASRPLAETFARLRARRLERMHRMIERLADLGVRVDAAEVLTREGASYGRPHLARALVARGACASVDEAFERWLAEGRPAYVEKVLLPSAEAIAAIRAAGGVPALAHAGRYRREPDIAALSAEGLRGLEVYHPAHDAAATRRYASIARELGLAPSGGSDFHGDPGRRPDLGEIDVPAGCLDELNAARTGV